MSIDGGFYRPCHCIGHQMPNVSHVAPCCQVPHIDDDFDRLRKRAVEVENAVLWAFVHELPNAEEVEIALRKKINDSFFDEVWHT